MEPFRKKCLDRNYLGECPIDGGLCKDIVECLQGEKEINRIYNIKMAEKIKLRLKPSAYGRVPFKRYEDKTWEELPTKYLKYLVSRKCKTSEENKNIAEEILRERELINKHV